MAEPTLETILAAITALRGEIAGKIDRLEQGLVKLEQGQTKLELAQTRLRVDLSERLDRLQNALDALRQGYIVDWGNVERGERIARGASEEVRALASQVSELTKFVHMLEAQIREQRGHG